MCGSGAGVDSMGLRSRHRGQNIMLQPALCRAQWLLSVYIVRQLRKGSREKNEQIIFYDSVTSKKLFVAPVGRSMDDFLIESENHGWPSFRDPEVVQSTVRVLPNGETVSADGTHLGHNLPDTKGNRYCINLVSVAGQAPTPSKGRHPQFGSC